MDYIFDETTKPLLKTQKPVSMLKTYISIKRVFSWLGMQLLLSLARFLVLCMQQSCYRQIILDRPAAAFATDSTVILDHDRDDMAIMSYCTPKDVALGRLSLAQDSMSMRFRLTVAGGDSAELLVKCMPPTYKI